MDERTRIITNEDYYLATEWNIIQGMRKAEAALAKVAVEACKDAGVIIDRNRVLEGYYGMPIGHTPDVNMKDLAEFFWAIRSLQAEQFRGKVKSSGLPAGEWCPCRTEP